MRILDFRIRYYGCVGESGHYLWEPGDLWEPEEVRPSRLHRRDILALPWGFDIDAGLCPKNRQKEGEALLHVGFDADGLPWTALAFWDRSVDTRPGSNSVFIVEGAHTAEQVIEMSRAAFPAIWARFTFAVEVRSS